MGPDMKGDAMGNALILTADTFDDEVLKSAVPVLVDFTATWCGPCQRLAPIVEELSVDYKGKVKVAKVDIDQCGDIAGRYGIMSVPTVIIFHKGEVQETMVGLNAKSHYKTRLDALVGAK
jgi:thioredoxin 1